MGRRRRRHGVHFFVVVEFIISTPRRSFLSISRLAFDFFPISFCFDSSKSFHHPSRAPLPSDRLREGEMMNRLDRVVVGGDREQREIWERERAR